MNEIGERLRTLRKAAGLRLADLAHQAGFSPSYISAIERGRVNPSIPALRKIAESLGQPLAVFFRSEATRRRTGPKNSHNTRHSLLKSVEKAADLLLVLAQSGPLPAKEIERQFRWPRSSAYRFLQALERRGFVARDQTHGFCVGPILLTIADGSRSRRDPREAALPHMQRLAEEFGESVFLSVKQGWEAVVIEKVSAPSPVRLHLDVGCRLPLHAGAFAKVLLAFGPARIPSAFRRRPLPHVGPRTVTDLRRLERELEEIRAKGYSVTLEEAFAESWGVAVPILLGSRQSVVASLTLGGPLQRFRLERIPSMVSELQQAARDIAEALAENPLDTNS